MNKKLLTIFILFLLTCLALPVATAQGFPMVVSGTVKFNSVVYAFQTIKITSPSLGTTWETQTNSNGIYQVVLNNLKDGLGRGINAGDTIYLDACDPQSSEGCRKTIYASTLPADISWDIAVSQEVIDSGATDIGTVQLCTDLVCPNCPNVQEPLPCPEPVEPDSNWWVYLLVGLFSAAGGAGVYVATFNNKIFTGSRTGIKTYRGTNGELKILHKHPGTTGYHDPKTQHRKPETHPAGMVDVGTGYTKNDKGLWEYN